MTFLEKNTWISGVTAILGLAVYLIWILTLADGGPLTQVNYITPMISTIFGSILLNILISILLGIFNTKRGTQQDLRDKEIAARGDYRGNVMVIIGALAALFLAMFEQPYFWIANTIYLSFVLSAVLAVIIKIVSYRRGF